MSSNQEKAKESAALATDTITSLASIETNILALRNECSDVAKIAAENKQDVSSAHQRVQNFKEIGKVVLDGSKETQTASIALMQSAKSLHDLASKFKV